MNIELGGAVGITSIWPKVEFIDKGDEGEYETFCGFVHWSESCEIFDNAALSRAEYSTAIHKGNWKDNHVYIWSDSQEMCPWKLFV